MVCVKIGSYILLKFYCAYILVHYVIILIPVLSVYEMLIIIIK